ncbi:hypothetical protein FJZ33_02305, partial [Candidatus Poribacteria bacterium]|nr:hypothetical protein [Candidatus Poribacteria bacterium]
MEEIMTKTEFNVIEYGAIPDNGKPDTVAIQSAIDACAKVGGGIVRIPIGTFLSGALVIRDNITLHLEKGAILKGSDNFLDYGDGKWLDALIKGENIRNIRIQGEGAIDGSDCRNPKGEEGFRGPHGILLTNCAGITIRDVTMQHIGNYAILCRNSTDANIKNVSFRGGHDGLHAQACSRFSVQDCDFRTGDDCLAGCDNVDFDVVNCNINSSCNGFRLGCLNLLVKNCRFWGPGEYQHRISKRMNMLSAFVHFAPEDRKPKLPSDNWLIQDITIDNVDFIYGYNKERGLWQTGQPAKRIKLQNVKAARLMKPIRVLGDSKRQFELILDNVSMILHPEQLDQELLNITQFGKLELHNVTLQNSGNRPVIIAKDGNTIVLDNVTNVPENDK